LFEIFFIFVQNIVAEFFWLCKNFAKFTKKRFDKIKSFDKISRYLIFYSSMICYSIKKEGETNEKLILRYKKSFFQTRTANKLRNAQTHSKAPSKRKIRESAIIREFYRSKGQGLGR